MNMSKGQEGNTKTFDPDSIDFRKYKHKWKNKKQFQTALVVRDRFEEHRTWRMQSCPWSAIDDRVSTTFGDRTGSDWATRWDLDYKLWSMYHEYLGDRSNLKSPTSFSPIEALMSEFMENHIGLLLSPTQESDKEKVKVIDYLVKHWEAKVKIDSINATSMKECAITGTSVRGMFYRRVAREVELIQNSQRVTEEINEVLRKGSDSEKDKLREILAKEKKPLTKKKTVIEYDDVCHDPISIYEVYFDPSARVMRGPSYECSDATWRQLPSLEEFRSQCKYSFDPYIIKENVDLVVSAHEAQATYTSDTPFFKQPSDIYAEDTLELLHYYNKRTDKYIVIANDVVIRDGPLPYNHKQIPISIHKFIEWPHMLYGVGLPVLLESLQSEDETLRNMMLEQIKLTINPPVFIPEDIFEDVDTGYERVEPGLKVPVSGDPTKIMWMPNSGYNPNYPQMRASLEQDGIKVSGVNSITYANPRPGEPVRNNMMTLESSLKMMKRVFSTWSQGYLEAMLQTIELFQQFYPDNYEIATDPSGKKYKKYRSIRLDGIKLEVEQKEDSLGNKRLILHEKESSPNDTSFFEVRGEYLDLDGDIDLSVDVETLVPVSQGLKMQNADRFVQTLVPLISNPMLMDNPAVVGLLRYYYEVHGVPFEVMDTLRDQSNDQEIEDAYMQNRLMMEGANVPSVPGESTDHIQAHSDFLLELIAKKNEMLQDPMTPIQMMQMVDITISLVSQHLEGDKVPKTDGSNYAMSKALPPVPQAPQNGMGMDGEGMMDMGMGMMGPEMSGGMPGQDLNSAGMMPPQGPMM